VCFHTFTLPEDRCVRLLVKNLGRDMPESVVREELESLNISVQGVTQLRSGRRDQDPAKNRPSTPTSLYQWREDLRCRKSDLSRTLRLASVGGIVRGPERHIAMQELPALWTYAAKLRLCTPVRRVWGLPPLRWLLYPAGTAPVLWLRGNHTANYRKCVKWKEAKAALAKQAPDSCRKSAATAHLTTPKEQRAGLSAEQMDLGEGWNHVRGSVLSRPLSHQPLFQIPFPAGHGSFREA